MDRSDSCGRTALSSTGRDFIDGTPAARQPADLSIRASRATGSGHGRTAATAPRGARHVGLVLMFRRGARSRRVGTGLPSLAGRRILVFDEGDGTRRRDRWPSSVASRAADCGATRSFVRTGSRRRLHARCVAAADHFKRARQRRVRDRQPPRRRDPLLERRLRRVTTDLDDGRCRSTMLTPMRLSHALSGQATVRPLPLLLRARGTRTHRRRRPDRRTASARDWAPPRSFHRNIRECASPTSTWMTTRASRRC